MVAPPQDVSSSLSSNNDEIAVNVLGTMGALFWSTQLIPQIYLNYQKKSTKGLQPSMMLLWALAGLPLGMHNILANLNVALQVQPQVLTFLSLITWTQVMFYGHNWRFYKCLAVLFVLSIIFAGVEIAVVFGFKYGSSKHVPESFLTALAVLSAIGLALGVLRHYWDIYTHRSVRGISWIFVLLDAAGDLTSLLSVVIQTPPDIKSAAIYGVELILWIGVMLAGLAFAFKPYFVRFLGEGEARREGVPPTGQTTSHSSALSVFRTSASSFPDLSERNNINGEGHSNLRLRNVETFQ